MSMDFDWSLEVPSLSELEARKLANWASGAGTGPLKQIFNPLNQVKILYTRRELEALDQGLATIDRDHPWRWGVGEVLSDPEFRGNPIVDVRRGATEKHDVWRHARSFSWEVAFGDYSEETITLLAAQCTAVLGRPARVIDPHHWSEAFYDETAARALLDVVAASPHQDDLAQVRGDVQLWLDVVLHFPLAPVVFGHAPGWQVDLGDLDEHAARWLARRVREESGLIASAINPFEAFVLRTPLFPESTQRGEQLVNDATSEPGGWVLVLRDADQGDACRALHVARTDLGVDGNPVDPDRWSTSVESEESARRLIPPSEPTSDTRWQRLTDWVLMREGYSVDNSF